MRAFDTSALSKKDKAMEAELRKLRREQEQELRALEELRHASDREAAGLLNETAPPTEKRPACKRLADQ